MLFVVKHSRPEVPVNEVPQEMRPALVDLTSRTSFTPIGELAPNALQGNPLFVPQSTDAWGYTHKLHTYAHTHTHTHKHTHTLVAI